MKENIRSRSLLLIAVVAPGAAACDRPTQPTSTASSATSATPTATPETPAPSPVAPTAAASGSAGSATEAPPTGTVVNFDSETAGSPSSSFEAVVGDWYVAEEAGAHGLKVDGAKWRSGTPSANIADQAKRLYGDRYAEFLDGVKAFAFFPFAVWKTDPPAGDAAVSVRFYPLGGKVDQAAGIAFAVQPDGSYLGVRANALEDNILYFRVVKGKRTVIDDVRNVPTPSKTWHTLALEIRGAKIVVTLDGQKRFEKTLDHAPAGRFGLWSKADSQVLFDDFTITGLSGGAH
jgi:hypothetical protein